MKWQALALGALFLIPSPLSAGDGISTSPPLSSASPVLAEMGKQLEDRTRPASERLQIIRAFEKWATAQVRPPLLAVLKDPQPEIRAAAARALGWLGNDEAVPALRELVETPDEAAAVRAAAVGSLGKIGDRSVRAVVITASRDPDASVREAALWSVALGPLVDPADRTFYLMRLAEDRAAYGELRAGAIRALANVKEAGVEDSLARILESEPRQTIALPPGQPTPQETLKLRAAEAGDVAAWSARALGQLEAKGALPLLLKSAEDPEDFFLRLLSIESLVAWNVPEAFPVLVRRLEDPVTLVRVSALMGLAKLGDRNAVDPVLARLSDHDPAVRAGAVATLAALGDPRVRPQLETLQEKESDPRVLGALETALPQLAR